MTIKGLKEKCDEYGIVCSGLRNEYIKKLVTYELNQRVLFKYECYLGYHAVSSHFNTTQLPNSDISQYVLYILIEIAFKPIQRPPVIIPQLRITLYFFPISFYRFAPIITSTKSANTHIPN